MYPKTAQHPSLGAETRMLERGPDAALGIHLSCTVKTEAAPREVQAGRGFTAAVRCLDGRNMSVGSIRTAPDFPPTSSSKGLNVAGRYGSSPDLRAATSGRRSPPRSGDAF